MIIESHWCEVAGTKFERKHPPNWFGLAFTLNSLNYSTNSTRQLEDKGTSWEQMRANDEVNICPILEDGNYPEAASSSREDLL